MKTNHSIVIIDFGRVSIELKASESLFTRGNQLSKVAVIQGRKHMFCTLLHYNERDKSELKIKILAQIVKDFRQNQSFKQKNGQCRSLTNEQYTGASKLESKLEDKR